MIVISNLKENSIISLDFSKKIIRNQYVLISVNSDDNFRFFYFFYLPFIVEAWKLIEYKSIIFIVSSYADNLDSLEKILLLNNTLFAKCIEYLKKQETNLIVIKTERNYGKITAMISRLFAGVLKNIDDDDYVITSDSDLIPIRKSYYLIKKKDGITILNGFCCGFIIHKGKKYDMYPMGHIGMKKKIWRDIMNLDSETIINSSSIIQLVRYNLEDKIVKKDNKILNGDLTWYADQTIVSIKISKYVNDEKKANLVKIGYKGIRFDRKYSDIKLLEYLFKNYSLITDFHTFQFDSFKRWDVTNELLKRLFFKEKYLELYEYYKEFKAIFNNLNNKTIV